MRNALFSPLVACVFALTASCSGGSSGSSGANGDDSASCGIQIDRFKELSIVDDAVVADARSLNASDGPWSFRHALEGLMPEGANASDFLTGWFDDWASRTTVNGFQVDREARGEAIQSRLVCPWLQRTPANGCDATCTQCTARVLDLAQAPFRLLAIVNRSDLRTRPDVTSPAGEARLVFGFTQGLGDDPNTPAGPMTVIFEYAMPPTTMSPKQWAAAWHNLGTHAAFDESYRQELNALTDKFVSRGAWPGRPNDSAISQVRSNESAFNWIWQLRQWQLNETGQLRLVPVANTPGEPLNDSDTLKDFVTANLDKVKNDQMVLPPSLLGGSANEFLFRWNIPGVDEPTRLAFAKATCNGCHSGENTMVDAAFHVSPFRNRKGPDKLSQFVNNPADPAHDDLAARTAKMEQLLCSSP